MILLQLSAAQGPAECCLAVARALQVLLDEAEQANVRNAKGSVSVHILEQREGPEKNTFHSVLLSVEGVDAQAFAASWCGTLQWIFQSPYRPTHRRKNWFISARMFVVEEIPLADEIRFETCRASGPGGQHVNKTESAIRATHVATGVSVRVQSERSQHANKRVAAVLLRHKLNELKEATHAEQNALRHRLKKQVERGSATRVFKGETFVT